MTSPNSSISSSEAKRYLAVLGLVACVSLVAAGLVSYLGFRSGRVDFSIFDLYAYQREKIRTASSVDTIFIGDSSLGNAIDAELWSRVTGRPTLNLALAGGYGLGGTLNMLRQALQRHEPATVIVMQTVDVLRRDVTYRGYLATAGAGFPADEVPLSKIARVYVNADTVIAVFRRLLKDALGWRKRRIENDYIVQRAPLDRVALAARARDANLTADSIKPEAVRFLDRIAKLCAERGLRCLYAHGPTLEAICAASGAYLQEISARVRAAGLAVVEGTPICLPPEHVGDSPDHVRPDLKQLYTRRYFDLMAPDLGPSSSP